MCEFILSLAIVGAMETEPGWMQIQYMENKEVTQIYVPTAVYIGCFEQVPTEVKVLSKK